MTLRNVMTEEESAAPVVRIEIIVVELKLRCMGEQ
jgi:hypothetical protein